MAQMVDALKATVEAEKTKLLAKLSQATEPRGYPRSARRSRPANRSSRDLPDRAPPDLIARRNRRRPGDPAAYFLDDCLILLCHDAAGFRSREAVGLVETPVEGVLATARGYQHELVRSKIAD